MKPNLNNFFPKDTLATELTSAGILLVSSILLLLGFTGVSNYDNIPLFIYILLPLLHILSLTVNKLKIVRAYASLLTGGLLVYLGFSNIDNYSFIGCISTIVLGFSNFYAFILNNQRTK